MEVFRNAKNGLTKKGSHIHWVRLVIAVLGLIIISFALSYLLQQVVAGLKLEQYKLAYLAYAIASGTALVSNLTIIAPVPFAVSVMVALAKVWNPVLIALAASIGGTIGELSGYYAGYLGTKIAVANDIIEHSRIERWINKYGIWTISFLAFQPVIPFDIGGIIAGAARMPLHKFLLALFLGKFPKYLILTYVGLGFIHYIPFLPTG